MKGQFADNPAYIEYESLLRRLHGLIAEGAGDDPVADSVRELMDAPERKLDALEIQRLNGLSADLYMLSGAEALATENGDRLDVVALYERVQPAQAQGDWNLVLEFLRQRSPDVPEEAVALSRARAYEALGHLDTAMLFLSYAAATNQREPLYEVLRLDLLRKSRRFDEAATLADSHLRAGDTPALLAIASADLLFMMDTDGGRQLPTPGRAGWLLTRLENTLSRSDPIGLRLQPFIVVAHLLRAGCLEALGRPHDAVRACDEALRYDPQSEELHFLRSALQGRVDVAPAFNRALIAAEVRAKPFETAAA